MCERIHLLRTVLIFSLTISCLQISLSQALPTSDTACSPECSVGQECVQGLCVCPQTCNSSVNEPQCASNRVTYDNLCELEKAKCTLGQNITVLYAGQCCQDHQRSFDNNLELFKRCLNGADDIDVFKCYRPQCNPRATHLYQTRQCGYFSVQCWCSTSSGEVIDGTLTSKYIAVSYCNRKQVCKVDGQSYNEGEIFTPQSICGLCECSSGMYSCFVNFTVDSNGHLSPQQLHTLKNALVQIFYHQRTTSNETSEIKRNLKTQTEVSTANKESVLVWKFNQYDKNQDGDLNLSEELIFQQELVNIFGSGCSTFRNHLNELYDANNDNTITLQEWNSFFGVYSQVTSGSAEMSEEPAENPSPMKREAKFAVRKPLHLRKKSFYQLS